MNIKEQTELAQKVTEEITRLIQKKNEKLGDGNTGCWIKRIDIFHATDQTFVTVTFGSNGTPIESFVCKDSYHHFHENE
jgi:hypothetical protein